MKHASDSTPSDLKPHLGFWMRYVSNQVSSRFESQLASHGVTVTEWVALRALYKQSSSTHAKLIGELGMTKGAASKVITKLEAKEFASRGYAIDNARDQILFLTPTGKRLLPKLAAVADENDEFFFGNLSKTNRAELMSMMRNLVAHHEMKVLPTK